jgi:hypothetical protein
MGDSFTPIPTSVIFTTGTRTERRRRRVGGMSGGPGLRLAAVIGTRVRAWRALAAGAAVILTVGWGTSAGAAPIATLTAEEEVTAAYGQGIARIKEGWVLTGRAIISRTDDKLREQKVNRRPIPKKWIRQGYNHVGDVDVVGKYIYAPLEQPNYELGEQVTARYDAKTLRFVDAEVLAQHENSFVTIDPDTMVAYSLDRFGGDALLRYDVRAGWKPLDPLPLSAFVANVQGGDVANGYVWLSTSNPTNQLYRVDLATGEVVDLGSAGHSGGEGEGIDATKLRSGRIHTLTIDPNLTPVWLGHFAVEG